MELELRPYELSAPQYGVWYEVGQVLGLHAQAAVASLFCGRSKRLHAAYAELDERSRNIVREIARRRDVILS